MIQIYCDGASDGIIGSWACLILRGKERYLLGNVDRGTNNQMEMIGCLEGLKFCQKFPGDQIEVISDSLLLVKGMNEWSPKWLKNNWKGSKGRVKNVGIWQDLVAYGKGVKFTWRHRRTGREMELVDTLAGRLLVNYELTPIYKEWKEE